MDESDFDRNRRESRYEKSLRREENDRKAYKA